MTPPSSRHHAPTAKVLRLAENLPAITLALPLLRVLRTPALASAPPRTSLHSESRPFRLCPPFARIALLCSHVFEWLRYPPPGSPTQLPRSSPHCHITVCDFLGYLANTCPRCQLKSCDCPVACPLLRLRLAKPVVMVCFGLLGVIALGLILPMLCADTTVCFGSRSSSQVSLAAWPCQHVGLSRDRSALRHVTAHALSLSGASSGRNSLAPLVCRSGAARAQLKAQHLRRAAEGAPSSRRSGAKRGGA